MNTDIVERTNEYEFKIDLPGFSKEDIEVEVENGNLKIHAKNVKTEEEKKEGKMIRQERYYGEISRSFYIGEEIESNDIQATFEDGVLTLTVPKIETEKDKKKYIEIK
ncbi:MAG: Hsp20 family protein [Erysipelotrichaceae bacterium]|nr:Hsp20 family protein [Erysipelotrichaceae bacterium]